MIETVRWLTLPVAGVITVMAIACGSGNSKPQEREVPADDVTLHVRIAGDPTAGEVLFGISGGPGLSSGYMASLERLAGPELAVVTCCKPRADHLHRCCVLQAAFRDENTIRRGEVTSPLFCTCKASDKLLHYDPRGAGRSTAPADDPANYGLFRYANDLEAVRKAVGAEKVHLLGHSWGGLVAMYYATVFPQHVDSIILMGSGPPNIEGLALAQRRFQERITELTKQGLMPVDLSSVAAGQVRAVLPAYFSDPRFEPPRELLDMTFSQTVSDLTMSALGQYDLTEELARLDQRVLILFGEDDPFGLSMAEATRDALLAAEVEFVVLEQCGHFWQECPERSFAAVRSFLGLPAGPDKSQ